jgi:O-antigen/teichoic acid export membrane protein
MNSSRPGLVSGSMMMAVALITAGVLSLLTSVVIARTVGASEFGIYSITVSLQGVLTIIASFSFGTAIAKYVSEYRVRDPMQSYKFFRTGLMLVLLFSTLTSVMYIVLADLIGNGLYREPGVAKLIPFSAMVVVSAAILSLVSGAAQGNHLMRLLSVMQISNSLMTLCIIVVFLPSVGIEIAFLAAFAAQMTVSLAAIHRLRTGAFSGVRVVEERKQVNHLRLILSFAVPAVMGAVMVAPIYWVGNTLLALDAGFLALGQFAVALFFFHALSVLPSSLAIPLVPRLSEMSVLSRDKMDDVVSRALRAVSVLFFPLFFAIALFAREIIGVLYTSEYSDATEPVYLMVASGYYFALGVVVGASIVGLGRMWLGLGLNIVWATMFVALALLFVGPYGPAGLGLAYLVSYLIHLTNTIIVSERVLKLRIRRVFAPIGPAIVLFATGFLLATDTGALFIVLRFVLLAVGTAVMLLLGWNEYVMLYDRILRRERRPA